MRETAEEPEIIICDIFILIRQTNNKQQLCKQSNQAELGKRERASRRKLAQIGYDREILNNQIRGKHMSQIWRKRLLASLIAIVLLCGLFPTMSFAEALSGNVESAAKALAGEAVLKDPESPALPPPAEGTPAPTPDAGYIPDGEETPAPSATPDPEEGEGEPPLLRGDGDAVTFTGTESGLCAPAVLFDAMAGVSAANSAIGTLAVKITDIASTDSAYVFTEGDTAFTPGEQTVPPTTYTITYAAYDPADLDGAALGTTTRTMTVFQAEEYHPGQFTITTTCGADPAAMTYRITDAIINDMFTVRYTVATGYTTNNTVLVVDTLKYGTQWACDLEDCANPNIKEVVRFSDTSYAILLADGLTGDVTIDFTLKYKALTQAQCIEWIDNGFLPASNISAREYYMPIGTLSDVLTDPTSILQPNEANYFNSDILPENTGAQTLTAPHTYNMTVSSVAELTNRMMSELGAGRAGGNNLYLYSNNPDPNFMYSIPTVHTAGTPLMEISGIKIYVPDARLKLIGLSNTPNARQTSQVYDPDYYQIWSNWIVGARQTDALGDYYMITPPAGTRVFNNGTDLKIGNLTYGMRLLWALADNEQELDYSDSAYTPHQAPNTDFVYKIPDGTASVAQSFSHIGPKVTTWIRKPATATQAYNPARHKDNSPNNNIIIGSYQSNQIATYLSNTWYKTAASGTVTEFVPLSSGAVEQSYVFPYEIQPENMTLTDQNQKDELNGRRTVLESVSYTTADGMTHHDAFCQVLFLIYGHIFLDDAKDSNRSKLKTLTVDGKKPF